MRCCRSCEVDRISLWSVSEASLQRYVLYASERCVQDLLTISGEDQIEGWKSVPSHSGIEISQKNSEAVTIFRGSCLLKISLSQFKTVANSINTAKTNKSNMASARKPRIANRRSGKATEGGAEKDEGNVGKGVSLRSKEERIKCIDLGTTWI
eukprot:Gb_24270 [translate_table: standard]